MTGVENEIVRKLTEKAATLNIQTCADFDGIACILVNIDLDEISEVDPIEGCKTIAHAMSLVVIRGIEKGAI